MKGGYEMSVRVWRVIFCKTEGRGWKKSEWAGFGEGLRRGVGGFYWRDGGLRGPTHEKVN